MGIKLIQLTFCLKLRLRNEAAMPIKPLIEGK